MGETGELWKGVGAFVLAMALVVVGGAALAWMVVGFFYLLGLIGGR